MPKPLEIPGPGEQSESYLRPESASGPIPEGEMLPPSDVLARFPEMASKPRQEISNPYGSDSRDMRRSTSTDRDAMPIVRTNHDVPERRLDHSADDLPREASFDPAQDDSGPR